MVARNGQHRHTQAVYEGAGRMELRRPCALWDVAQEHEPVGLLLPGQRRQCFDDWRLFRAAVRGRDLLQDADPADPSSISRRSCPCARSNVALAAPSERPRR